MAIIKPFRPFAIPGLSHLEANIKAVRDGCPEYGPSALVHIAKIAMDDFNPVEVRLQCHVTLAKYTACQLKSVDIRDPGHVKDENGIVIEYHTPKHGNA